MKRVLPDNRIISSTLSPIKKEAGIKKAERINSIRNANSSCKAR
jgi:hypothetical protein